MPIRRLFKRDFIFKKVIIISLMMVAFFCSLCLTAKQVQAQVATSVIGEGVQTIAEPLGLPKTDIRMIVARIIRAALSLLGIITVVLIMYGGYVWMTAGGNEEQIGRARKILVNAVIGLLIILSAYAIVLFVMKMLGVEGYGQKPQYAAPGSEHFAGSGALGRIIKDHYPERDQVGVARNTKIVISFYKPIHASSTIADTNGNGIFGDCLTAATFNWADPLICDRLRTVDDKVAVAANDVDGKLTDKYINISELKTGQSIKAAVALASTSTVKGVIGVYTLVIKPLTDLKETSGGYLGSATEEISYKVHLGPEMRLDDPLNNNPKLFEMSSVGSNYYEWNFTCGTSLDVTPPRVVNVYPDKGKDAPRNSVIQINFDEAMDPTGIQGSFASTSTHYELTGGYIYLRTGNTSKPIGNFILTNGYQTLEFTSSVPCEQKNACGNTMYCLPVCDKVSGQCDTKVIQGQTVEYDKFVVLLKAARTFSLTSFEAKPFSGIMDLASNALDSDPYGQVDVAPTSTPVFPNQQKPDNYAWNFNIKNQVDLSSAYLSKITPGPDAQFVSANQELSLNFTKQMRVDSLNEIKLEEHPTTSVPICYYFRSVVYPAYTYTQIKHCPFLYAKRYYYLPTIPSEAEDVNFNCYYPGQGPRDLASINPQDSNKDSKVCDGATNCCQYLSTTTPGKGDLCCNGEAYHATLNPNQAFITSSSCRTYLKQL